MARYLIREAHGGETRTIRDGALPYFQNQGWVVLDTLDDADDASPLYLSKAEGDLRWAKIADLGDPESAEVAVISEVVADSPTLRAAFDAGDHDWTGAHDFTGASVTGLAGGGTVPDASTTTKGIVELATTTETTTGTDTTRAVTPAGAKATFEPKVDSIWVPFTQLSTVTGTATLANAGATLPAMSYPDAADTRQAIYLDLPSTWANFTIDLHYTNLASTSGNIIFLVDYLHVGPGDAYNVLPNASVMNAYPAGTQYVETVKRMERSLGVESYPAPTAPKRLYLRTRRPAADALDSHAGAVGLLGLTLTKV